MRISIKTAGTALLLAVGLLLSACARDYTDDLLAADQEMNALEQADQELRAYLTQCISEARTRLNEMLKEADGQLTADIKTRFGNLKSDISARMESISNKMDEDFQQKEALVGEKIAAIDALLKGEDGLEARLQKKLDDTNQAVLQHQTDNNDMLAKSLKTYRDKLGELTTKIGKLDDEISKWKETLDKSMSADWTKQLEEMEKDIKELEDFKATDELDKMVTVLEKFTEEQFWLLETEDLKKLIEYYNNAVELSGKVVDPLADTEGKLSDFESDFDNYETQVDVMLLDLSSFDTSFSELDEILDAKDVLEEIDSYIDDIDDIIPEIEAIVEEMEEMRDRAEEGEDTYYEAGSNLADWYGSDGYASSLLDAAVGSFMDLVYWIDELKDKYPWWDW